MDSMTKETTEEKIKFIGDEITSLLAICLDIETPEETRIILRKELQEIKTEIDKMIADES